MKKLLKVQTLKNELNIKKSSKLWVHNSEIKKEEKQWTFSFTVFLLLQGTQQPCLPCEFISYIFVSVLIISPWYNHTGWVGVKHQFTYLLLTCCKCVMLGVQVMVHSAENPVFKASHYAWWKKRDVFSLARFAHWQKFCFSHVCLSSLFNIMFVSNETNVSLCNDQWQCMFDWLAIWVSSVSETLALIFSGTL